MARVRFPPVKVRQTIGKRKNPIDLNQPNDMLLSLPSDDNHDNIGVWRLERKFETDEYTKLEVPFMEWKNVADNQAAIPEYYADPVLRERMRALEPLREELIADPVGEERERRARERAKWTEMQEKTMCAALARHKYEFGLAAKRMQGKTRAECIEHWYSYKQKEEHIAGCFVCSDKKQKKLRRKRAAEARARSAMNPVIPVQPKRLDNEDDDDIFVDVETVDVEEGSFSSKLSRDESSTFEQQGKEDDEAAGRSRSRKRSRDVEELDIEEGPFFRKRSRDECSIFEEQGKVDIEEGGPSRSRKRSRDEESVFEEQGKVDIEEGGPSRSRKRSRDEESVFEEQRTGDIEEGSPSPKRSRNEHSISEEQEKNDVEDRVPSCSVWSRKRPRDEASIVEEIEKTDSKNGAPPLKRSRVGRGVVVPRRFRDGPEGWSRQH